jgi:hypothetical protein
MSREGTSIVVVKAADSEPQMVVTAIAQRASNDN